MARIPDNFLHELRERLDIVAVVQERLPLKKMGTNYSACCPFHDEKTPSFTVSATKQFFHCFGCGAHGDPIEFISKLDGLTFIEAIEKLAQQVGLKIPETKPEDSALERQHQVLYDVCARAAELYQEHLQSLEGKTGRDYLQARGLTAETIEKFSLGYAPSQWDALCQFLSPAAFSIETLTAAGLAIEKTAGGHYDRFRSRIMFPIQDVRGRILGFGGRVLDDSQPKYLNSPETMIFHKGHTLYGLPQALKAQALRYILVVEGYMDVIALSQAGIAGVVATLGTAVTSFHLKRLYQANVPIIFCFDGDAAGQKAAWRALENTLPLMEAGRDIRFMLLPKGEDPDSVVRGRGKQAIDPYIEAALPFSEFFFKHLQEQVSLESVDGRAKLAALAKPLLAQLPVGVYQQLMQEQLNALIGLNRSERRAPQPEYRSSQRVLPKALSSLSLTEKVLGLLLADSTLKNQLTVEQKEMLSRLSCPESATLQQVLYSKELLPAGLRASQEVAVWISLLTPEGRAMEWEALLQKLEGQLKQSQIEMLLSKAKQAILSDSEKGLLKILLGQ